MTDWLFYVQPHSPARPDFSAPGFSCAPEGAELADTLDLLGRADVTTLEHIKRVAPSEFALWLGDRKNAGQIPHRLEACGYVSRSQPGC
jgi:hypothetical protein